MAYKWRPLLVWAISILGMILTFWALILQLRQQAVTPQPLDALASDITYILLSVPMILVGGFLSIRKSDNIISWIILGGGLSLLAAAFTELFANSAAGDPNLSLSMLFALWIAQWVWLLPYLTLVLLLLFYPTGRLLSSRWRWVLTGVTLAYAVMVVWLAFGESLDAGTRGGILIPNPVGFLPYLGRQANVLMVTILVSSMAAGLLAISLRFRRARGIERQQLK
jgi:hypothetical protein